LIPWGRRAVCFWARFLRWDLRDEQGFYAGHHPFALVVKDG
jgi:hypothetical protein